jgi:ubiquinone/menaquinone biosynthesis C-methylase UbiE
MDIKELQKNWDEFGKVDPLWSILTHDSKKDNKWALTDFFRTGQEEIDQLFNDLKKINLQPSGQALDFGCGVGRLTQALAKYFSQVDGVDIAPSMIEQANKLNQFPEKIHYHVNSQPNLELFSDNSFDLVFTVITLQHIYPSYTKNYLKEFLRILKPGGILIFQLPSHKNINWPNLSLTQKVQKTLGNLSPLWLKDSYYWIKSRLHHQPYLRMYNLPQKQVEDLINKNGGRIIQTTPDDRAGNDWISIQYIVTK